MRKFALGALFALVAAVSASAAAAAAPPSEAPAVSPAAALSPTAVTSDPSKFVPVTPTRILDTRSGIGADGPVPPGGTVTLVMPGRGGVPSSGVTAVLLNVTVAEAAAPGFVQVFPTGQADVGSSSNLNVEYAGQTVPNLVVAPLGDVGQVSLYMQGGGHLLADVFGYFTAASSSTDGRYVPVFPNRILDTRMQAPGKLGAGGSVRVQIVGRNGVPAAGASAVVLNVTATEATEAGFVQVLPTAQVAFGAFSNLNLVPGQTVPNLVVVPVGADGSVTVYSQRGTHVVVDVFGYFTNQAAAMSDDGLFVPLSPARMLDTRRDARPSAGSITSIAPSGRAGLPATGVAAVFGNLTATEASGPGYVQVAPGPAAAAPIGFWSNANIERAGQTIPNASIANLGNDATMLLYTSASTHLLFDVGGYFTGAASIVNHAPTVVPIQRSVTGGQSIDINVLDYASEPDGDPMTVTAFSQPGDGSVSRTGAGSIRYDSLAGADRTVSFSVVVADNRGASTTTTVTVFISRGVAPAPCSIDYGGSGTNPAEDAQLGGFGSAGKRCVNSGFRGSGYIGDWNGDQAVTFYVFAPASGQYNVSFRYQNATETSTRQLDVPSGTTTMVFANTHGGDVSGDWANGSWREATVNVTLNAGTNAITLRGGSGFVDLDEISSVVSTPGGLPAAPSVLTGTALSWSNPTTNYRDAVGQFLVQWQDNATNEAGFRVYSNGPTCNPSGPFALVATTGPNATSATVSVIGYSGRNCANLIRVVAFNASGESAPSNSYTVVTPTPNRPQIVSYVRLGTNTVQVQWTHQPVLGFQTYDFVLFSASVPSSGYLGSIGTLAYTAGYTGYGFTYTALVSIPSGADQTPYQCVTVYPATATSWPYGVNESYKSSVACLSSGQPGVDPGVRTLQAEDAQLSGAPAPSRSTDNPGYTGSGYVGTFGYIGQRVTFNVTNVGTQSAYYLYLRERSIETGVVRRIYVNGADQGLISIPRTSTTWTADAWANTMPMAIALHQGNNTIVVEYVGSGGSGYMDLDSILVAVA